MLQLIIIMHQYEIGRQEAWCALDTIQHILTVQPNITLTVDIDVSAELKIKQNNNHTFTYIFPIIEICSLIFLQFILTLLTAPIAHHTYVKCPHNTYYTDIYFIIMQIHKKKTFNMNILATVGKNISHQTNRIMNISWHQVFELETKRLGSPYKHEQPCCSVLQRPHRGP